MGRWPHLDRILLIGFIVAVLGQLTLLTTTDVFVGQDESVDAGDFDQGVSPRAFSVKVPPIFGKDRLVIKHEVPVVNDTPNSICIKDIHHSCACSKAQLDKMEVTPGNQSMLQIEVDMTRFGGSRRVDCLLETSQGDLWKYVFDLTAYPFLQPVDNNLEYVSFGEVDPGEECETCLDIYLHAPGVRNVPPVVVSAECETDEVRASVKNNEDWEILADGSGTRRKAAIRFSLSPQSCAGSQTSTCRIRYRGERIEGDARFTLSWQVRPAYELSPNRIYLDSIDAIAGSFTRPLSIRRLDGQSLEIHSVKTNSSAVVVKRIERVASDQQRIVFEVTPESIRDVLLAETVVRTNHPRQPIIVVVISGRRKSDAPSSLPTEGPVISPSVSY